MDVPLSYAAAALISSGRISAIPSRRVWLRSVLVTEPAAPRRSTGDRSGSKRHSYHTAQEVPLPGISSWIGLTCSV